MIDARCSTPPHTRARAAPPRAMVDPPPPDPPRHARNRSLSAPLRIDLTGAAIEPSHHSRASSARAVSRTDAIAATTPGRDANTVPSRPHGVEAPAITLPRQRDAVRHFALDLGGSLVKLVYFRPDGGADGARGGRLHFKKFPSAHLDDCLEFIEFKGLHLGSSAVTRGDDAEAEADDEDARAVTVKATGGGAYKFSKVFQERLGITLQKEDEMACAVAGAKFLLEKIRDEAFTYTDDTKEFISKEALTRESMYPYLLVNIGSGVSIIKVDKDGHERVSGSNIGGGTFWGLCRLLTGLKDYDEMLKLSAQADNAKVDMLVGDIYGGRDYQNIGLSSETIASSFGRVVMDEGSLEDYSKADITLSLLRMISYNIAHISTMNAVKYGLKRIFFGGYFIRNHAYTMNTISFAVDFWSKGELKAMFLRHEGFLGALGAFLQDVEAQKNLSDAAEGSWIEKFIKCSVPPKGLERRKSRPSLNSQTTPPRPARRSINAEDGGAATTTEVMRRVSFDDTSRVRSTDDIARDFARDVKCVTPTESASEGSSTGDEQDALGDPAMLLNSAGLQVGVLHLEPTLEKFPLLREGHEYDPNIFDMLTNAEERDYWLNTLERLQPGLVERALVSDATSADVKERAENFDNVFRSHLSRLRNEPAAYGKIGLADLFEMREECLRFFRFNDVYRDVKKQENQSALLVLPDLLAEIDSLNDDERLLSIVEGVLAGNIFDWGSQGTLDLYRNGTILEIYRKARSTVNRPWAIDDYDALRQRFNGARADPYRKALLFCDNSGADIILGMLPFARELLKRGTSVVLVANSLPAINDITADELNDILRDAAGLDDQIDDAVRSGALSVVSSGAGSPCLDFRRLSNDACVAARDADLIVLEGMGRAVHTNYRAQFSCDTLKLAMIKNQRLANALFGPDGKMWDCVCAFARAPTT
jgi:pantothenate kinase